VLENYKVGQLKKYGLDYATLKEIKPDIIYCSVTGFGQTGPYAQRAGYDFIIQGIGGFMSITGERDGLPGGGPQKAGVAITDLMTGMYSTVAVLTALAHRDRTGEGQYIDMALLDVQVAMLANVNSNFLASGQPPVRWGNAHPNIVPYQVFACADGHLIIAVGNDDQFARFASVAGHAHWASDPRFATNAERVRQRSTLLPLIETAVRTRTQHDWLGALEAVGVPCGPINRIDQVFSDPQVVARGLQFSLQHPLGVALPMVAMPLAWPGTPHTPSVPPPLLGEHTRAVLVERLAFDDARIAALDAAGVIQVQS
jgi:crotonobetainyl-CoA:carnitine CoA-transferase CaiB-like acyl-CoA transferase